MTEYKVTRIGLLGTGAIGRGLAMAVDSGLIGPVKLESVFDQYTHTAQSLSDQLTYKPNVCNSFQDFIDDDSTSLIVEAASQKAAIEYSPQVLSSGKDMMIMSSGALLDTRCFQEISRIQAQNGSRVFVPSGAIGGIDAIRASKAELSEVILTTRKPTGSLRDTEAPTSDHYSTLQSETVVFEGNAIDAVRRFPANTNVAATVSLAGLGPEKTLVRVIADPQATRNTHEIYANGSSGVMRFTMENVPDPNNPMTSYMAILSAIETLRVAIGGAIRIGT